MKASIPIYISIGLLAWGVGYLLNSPIPKGYQEKWSLRAVFGFLRLRKIMNYVKGFFMEPEDILVSMRDSFTVTTSKEILALPVKVEIAHFDGVMVRVYRPAGLQRSNNPGIVYYHGGGWVVGDTEKTDWFCRQFAYTTNAVTVSVEYRRAPEHVYPVPLDDCVQATMYFMKNADHFSVDATRVALMGDSAGGNLAAATALRLRDMKFEPQPKLQVLIYPCMQAFDFRTPSYQANKNDPLLPPELMAKFWNIYATGNTKHVKKMLRNEHTPLHLKRDLYLKQLNHDLLFKERKDINYIHYQLTQGDEKTWTELKDIFMDPYFAPLMSKDLGNLPEAVVLTAEQDVLMSDGILFAQYLESFKVPVTMKHFESGFHGVVSIPFNHVVPRMCADYLQKQVKSKL